MGHRPGRRAGWGLLLGFTLLVGAIEPAAAASKSVSIKDFAFNPASISIHVGDTVMWTNNEVGTTNHTVTADSGSSFDSGHLAPGNSFSHTFNSAGTFGYHCSIHSYMTGTVTVSAVSSSPTPTATHTSTPSPTHKASATPKPTATATAEPKTRHASGVPTTSAKPSPRASASHPPSSRPHPTPSTTVEAARVEKTGGSAGTIVIISIVALVLAASAGFGISRARTHNR